MNSIVSVFWNALLTAIVVTLLAGLFVAAMPPVYRATAVVKGDTDAMLMIQSGDMLQTVIRNTKADLGELEGWLEDLMSARADPVNLLKEKLFVNVGTEPGWVNISVEAQSADTAVTLANDLAHHYLKRSAKVRLSPEEKARLFAAAEASDSRLLDYLRQHPVLLNPAAGKARLDSKFGRADESRSTLLKSREDIKRLHLAASRGEVGVLTEPGVVRAAGRLAALEIERARLVARYGAQHLRMVGHQAEIKKATALLAQEIDAYQLRLEAKTLELEQALSRLDRELANIDTELDQFVSLQLELKALELAKEAAVRKYEGMTEASDIELVADAVPPRNTFGFNQLILLGFVFLVSFMLMVLLMVLRSLREK